MRNENSKDGSHVVICVFDIAMNSYAQLAMINNLVEIIKSAKEAGAQVVNDVRVINVSLYPAKADKGVDYWATLTVDAVLEGMIAIGDGEYAKGKTKTVTVPMGTLVTMLYDCLLDVDSDEADSLLTYKQVIIADAEKEALSSDDAPYVSHLHKLLIKSKVNILSREVTKGKVKSLFSLNEKEVEVENDSIWHDLYGLSNVSERKIAAAAEFAENENKANKASKATSAQDNLAAILAAYTKQNNAANINAALG